MKQNFESFIDFLKNFDCNAHHEWINEAGYHDTVLSGFIISIIQLILLNCM